MLFLNRGINFGGKNTVDRVVRVNLMSLLDWEMKWILCFRLDVRRRMIFQIELFNFQLYSFILRKYQLKVFKCALQQISLNSNNIKYKYTNTNDVK